VTGRDETCSYRRAIPNPDEAQVWAGVLASLDPFGPFGGPSEKG
jgi:hypothetical protein